MVSSFRWCFFICLVVELLWKEVTAPAACYISTHGHLSVETKDRGCRGACGERAGVCADLQAVCGASVEVDGGLGEMQL